MLTSDNKSIVIVCAADNNYVMPLAVAVRSLILNHKSSKKIVLFVIDGGIKRFNKRKILNLTSTSECNIEIEFLKPDVERLKNMKVSGYATLVTYYRLLIPELLSDSIEKVIYLDCDLIVNKNLQPLWDIDMGENYVMAAQDLMTPYVSSPYGLANYKELGMPSDTKYFNAGVMVINLEKWRTNSISAKIIEYLEQNKEHVRWWDQDGLNAVLTDKWGELDTKWNRLVLKEDVYDDLVNNSCIIHFASALKPWHFPYKHPTKDLFFQYLNMTPWSGWKPREPLRSIFNRYWWKLKYNRYWWRP